MNTFALKQKKEQEPGYEETSRPWDRLPNETELAFEAFKIYRQMGYSRDATKTAIRIYGATWESNIRFVEQWIETHEWEKRTILYDQFVRKHKDDIIEEQADRARMKFAEALPDIADTTIQIASGKKKGDRVQATLIREVFDRGGLPKTQPAPAQTNINFQIVAPDLPKEVLADFEVEDSATDIREEAAKLIPDNLRK